MCSDTSLIKCDDAKVFSFERVVLAKIEFVGTSGVSGPIPLIDSVTYFQGL